MTYLSSNGVSGLEGNFAFSEVSKPLDAGNNEGIETCKMLVLNCNVIIKNPQINPSNKQNIMHRVTEINKTIKWSIAKISYTCV